MTHKALNQTLKFFTKKRTLLVTALVIVSLLLMLIALWKSSNDPTTGAVPSLLAERTKIRNIVAKSLKEDFGATLSQATQLSGVFRKQWARVALVDILIEQEMPARAFDLAVFFIETGQRNDDQLWVWDSLLEKLLERWTQTDLESVLNKVLAIDEVYKRDAIHFTARYGAYYDPIALGDWVQRIDEETDPYVYRFAIYRPVVMALAGQDLIKADAFVASIDDERLRKELKALLSSQNTHENSHYKRVPALEIPFNSQCSARVPSTFEDEQRVIKTQEILDELMTYTYCFNYFGVPEKTAMVPPVNFEKFSVIWFQNVDTQFVDLKGVFYDSEKDIIVIKALVGDSGDVPMDNLILWRVPKVNSPYIVEHTK